MGTFQDAEKNNQHVHYRIVMENLKYLEKSTQPDIAYVVYQCAQLYEDTIKTHGEAIERIGL